MSNGIASIREDMDGLAVTSKQELIDQINSGIDSERRLAKLAVDQQVQLDGIRGERDLMERMYHASLTQVESLSNANEVLRTYQTEQRPAVRAVREILEARPDLKDANGIVKFVLWRNLGTEERRESICVAEIKADGAGVKTMRCTNCNETLCTLTAEEVAEAEKGLDREGIMTPWRIAWNLHTGLTSDGHATKRGPTHFVCGCNCMVCRRGVHCQGEGCVAKEEPVVNPNAGIKQAFPKGRWT